MPKNVIFLLISVIFFCAISFASQAAECSLDGAKVTRVMQWKDGHIFVYFDKNTDCNCSFPNRMAFHKNDDEKFFMSASLAALTAGKTVFIKGEDLNCPVHGNTAKLTVLTISAE